MLETSLVLSRIHATQSQDDVERLSDEDLQRLFNDQVVAMLVQAGETDEAAREIVAKLASRTGAVAASAGGE